MTDDVNIDVSEAVALGALDSSLFYRTFFPKTSRQAAPQMHKEIDSVLDGTDRLVNIIMARGWAKTSKLRMYAGKRIAYNISRTIVYVGASETHSRRSIRWLRKQVEKNKLFAQTFGLRPGRPWTDEEAQIIHEVEEAEIWITGIGVTSSSSRGINFDDYRPDLIIMDDVMNDENAASTEGREKIINLTFGAFKESLAPRTDAPFAKLVMLNTPQDYNDVSQLAMRDKEFVSRKFGCWTPETENLPIAFRKSAWEERVPTKELIGEYEAAAARNRLSIFIREKECKLTSPENSAFRADWLRYFGDGEDTPEPPKELMWVIIVIDPVPPPSDLALAKGVVGGDFEAITAIGRYKNEIYVLETSLSRGHTPDWTWSEVSRMGQKWGVRKVLIETIAYQKVLSWYLREQMKKYGRYYLLEEFGRGDKRPKQRKITDGISGVASNGQLFCRRSQTEFITQYTNFSNVKKIGHDDVIETVAIGCTELLNKGLNVSPNVIDLNEDEYEDLTEDYRGAP